MLFLLFAFFYADMFITWSLDAGLVRWELLQLGLPLTLFFYVALSRKTVQMDEQFLYVSVFRRVAQIPLDQISTVTEAIGMRDRSVTIHFRIRTPFGQSITFSPTYRYTRDAHPIVAELLAHVHLQESSNPE